MRDAFLDYRTALLMDNVQHFGYYKQAIDYITLTKNSCMYMP